MELSEKISVLQILKDLSLKEADLIWKRFASMLYVNTGLLGVASFSIEKKQTAMVLGCAFVGIIISLVWFQIIRLSHYYYKIWRVDADELIRNDPDLCEIINTLSPGYQDLNLHHSCRAHTH